MSVHRLLFVAALTFNGSLRAERLSMREAVEIARQNSPAILESAAGERAAGQALREARAARLPSFELREVAMRTDSPADVFGLKLLQERFSFPAFVASDPNQPDAITSFATELQVSQPIFTGGRLTAGINQADQMVRAATAVHGRTDEAVSFMVAGAYLDILLADRFLELSEKARDTTARHLDQARAYFDAGMIVESDLLQAEVQMARMEEALITARNNALLARSGLNRAMGVDQARTYDLDRDVPGLAQPWPSLDDALAAAAKLRKDSHAVSAKVTAAELGIDRARGELFPEVAVIGKVALNDDRFPGGHGSNYSVMAVARWNLWNWGQTQARVARSRDEYAAATEAKRGYNQQIEFEVRQAWQGVEEAHARSDVASKAVGSAEKALSILEARFEQGVSKVTDLLDAETMLNEARARDLKGRFDVERSLMALNFATGLPPVADATTGSEER